MELLMIVHHQKLGRLVKGGVVQDLVLVLDVHLVRVKLRLDVEEKVLKDHCSKRVIGVDSYLVDVALVPLLDCFEVLFLKLLEKQFVSLEFKILSLVVLGDGRLLSNGKEVVAFICHHSVILGCSLLSIRIVVAARTLLSSHGFVRLDLELVLSTKVVGLLAVV